MSYVRCQRCERPVCPQCQRPAAVGVQCVDCVKEQAKTVRTARTVFGGQAHQGRPVVTLGLIGLSVVVFVLQLVPGSGLTSLLAFAPSAARSEPWRFVTGAFLHSTGFPLHIVFNMIVLYQIGPYLETALGRVRYLVLYLVSAIGGSVGYLALADPLDGSSWNVAVVGASGAVFGLFGAMVVVQRRLRHDSQGLFVIIAINFGLGFVIANVAWQGHLGGLITGVALAAALVLPPRQHRTVLQAAGVLVVLAVLVLVAVTKLAAAAQLGA